MMFRLAYIGAPPTMGSPAAIAPPATARAITAAVLSSLIFMIGAPFGLSSWASAALGQCDEHLPYEPGHGLDAARCIHFRIRRVIASNGLDSTHTAHSIFARWIALPPHYPLSVS